MKRKKCKSCENALVVHRETGKNNDKGVISPTKQWFNPNGSKYYNQYSIFLFFSFLRSHTYCIEIDKDDEATMINSYT